MKMTCSDLKVWYSRLPTLAQQNSIPSLNISNAKNLGKPCMFEHVQHVIFLPDENQIVQNPGSFNFDVPIARSSLDLMDTQFLEELAQQTSEFQIPRTHRDIIFFP